MKYLCFTLIMLTSLSKCNFRLGFPEVVGSATSAKRPESGCLMDVNVHFKNNCEKDVRVLFIEINPGDTFTCTSLNDLGILKIDETRNFLIRKSKLGYFKFTTSTDKCGSNVKVETWVDCSKASGTDSYFNTCQ